MAYFDSPKNRALWDKELNELRKEKEARAKGHGRHNFQGSKPQEMQRMQPSFESSDVNEKAFAQEAVYSGPMRERTSYRQLLAEEAASVRAAREMSSRSVLKERTNTKETSHFEAEAVTGARR